MPSLYPLALTITNGNAEATTGWTSSVGTLSLGNFGGVHQGTWKFYSSGAPTSAGSIHRHYQDIAISGTYNTDIDAGNVDARFVAWLSRGGPDRSRIEIEALDGVGGTSLGSTVGAFQPTTAPQFVWLEGEVWLNLPVGTRAIRIWVAMENNDAGNTDGYVDGPMSLTLYGPELFATKLVAQALPGAWESALAVSKLVAGVFSGAAPGRLTVSKLVADVFSGASPRRLTASKLVGQALVALPTRARNGPVQII